MDTPKFKNKNGTLTVYALVCGYIEEAQFDMVKHTIDTGREVQLIRESSGCYAVKAYDFAAHKRIAWDCFETLTEARKAYRRLCRQVSKG